jgi:Gluconate 2-dehydrogenase subunit 3
MMPAMNRRDAVKAASLLVGGAVAMSSGLLGCSPTPESLEKPTREKVLIVNPALSAADIALIEAVADTILPETPASPGAKAAGCGAAMEMLLRDCYTTADQRRARQGLAALRSRAPDFAMRTKPAREALLRTVDGEAQTAAKDHWFQLLHELSQRSYFSSEVGVTKALRYVMEPGGFAGCVPLTPGQPAWS